MNLEESIQTMLPEIESQLKSVVARLEQPRTTTFHEMLTYHMGWTGQGAGADASGKRIRPLMLLLTVAACGKDWKSALPAAAAVELIHNFSLVHDDVQDGSELRRGRPTVWKTWGIPQAINAGDGLFVLANMSLADQVRSHPEPIVLEAARVLQGTCLDLTRGQFLDISFETRTDVNIDEYWEMITGKTAALLSACCEIGALLGDAPEDVRSSFRDFGHYLGLAFQVKDDFLGLWGESAITGKSTTSDLITGKKTLPVLFGLETNGAFAQRWRQGGIQAEEAPVLADLLATEGIKLKTQESIDQLTDLALRALRTALDNSAGDSVLYDLALALLERNN